MGQKMLALIEVEQLVEIYKSENVILIDVSNGKDARIYYQNLHLDSAIYVDLNSQLAKIPQDFALSGRHPLPSLESFATTLGDIGINTESHIVLYDDKNGANAAARFWWMLRSVGHDKVQVLNGGFQKAVGAGFPVNNDLVQLARTSKYQINNWELPLAYIFEVETSMHNPDYLVIDVRESNRFNGIIEPVDLIAGHIPGAINIPFTENLNDLGLFRSKDELNAKYSEIIGNKDPQKIIVHCGSGVTACHTLLAMDYAGLSIPKLYVGSGSEWSRNNKPMTTKITN